MTKQRILWTDEDDCILKANHHQTIQTVAFLLPCRSQRAIKKRWQILKTSPVPHQKWSEKEDSILRQHDGDLIQNLLPLLPGRSEIAIQCRAAKIGISLYKSESKSRLNEIHKLWSDEETEILTSHSDLSLQELHQLLPHRSIHAINQRRHYLKIRKTKADPKTKTKSAWTESEDQILKDNQNLTWQKLALLLPSRTVMSIIKRSSFLGLNCKNRHERRTAGSD